MVSEPEAKAKTAPVSKVIEQMPTAESVQEPAPQSATTQESAEDTNGPTFDQVKTVKHETAFDEWIANGKKIPEGLAFVGGSPWFDEATGKNRSDEEVYELVFGGVTNSSELQGDENVKDEATFDEWVANGKNIPAGLVFAGGSPWFDEKTGSMRSDMEVYKLIFGCVTKNKELEDKVGVKNETTFDEWAANGKKIPEGLAFAGGSPWFNEATGKTRSDTEVYKLLFGGVTEGSELKVEESIKEEATFDEWVANGKKIPEGLVFVGGSPWFDEKAGKIRSDMEVYKLIFGCVTKKRELEAERGVKDETTLDEQVASGNEVLGRARDSSFSDEKKGGEIVESGTVFHKLLEPSKWFCCGA